MKFVWSETKRAANRRDHRLDFADVSIVFDGTAYTVADDRFFYGERRFLTLGLLDGVPVAIVHTEDEYEARIISFRKATKREAKTYFEKVRN